MQAAVALEHIAHSFGEEPKPTPQAADQRALAGRRFLLILDGTEVAAEPRQVLDIRDQGGVSHESAAQGCRCCVPGPNAGERLSPATETVVRLATYYTTFVNTHRGQFERLNPIRSHVIALLQSGGEHQAWAAVSSLAWTLAWANWADRMLIWGRWSKR
jgi:hypothetical protein